MKSILKLVIPLAMIVIISISGGLRGVPLWACVLIGAGIQAIMALLIELIAEFWE